MVLLALPGSARRSGGRDSSRSYLCQGERRLDDGSKFWVEDPVGEEAVETYIGGPKVRATRLPPLESIVRCGATIRS